VIQDYDGNPKLVGDRLAIEQAGLILIENAIKYTPPGGTITVRTGVDGDKAKLVVEDTGVGIEPEHIERIGERFYRGSPAKSRAAQGVGLGLAIAHRIAAAHHGGLRVSSESGRGTTVTLSLATSGPTG
jgi:signal transduction histidine kinase